MKVSGQLFWSTMSSAALSAGNRPPGVSGEREGVLVGSEAVTSPALSSHTHTHEQRKTEERWSWKMVDGRGELKISCHHRRCLEE